MANKKEKMVRRIVTQTVTVVREGKRVTPPINDPKGFHFTESEITYLDRNSPAATRRPTNESAVVEEPEVKTSEKSEEPPVDEAKPAAKAPKRRKTAKKAEPETDESEDDEAEDADESEDDDI